MLRRYFKQYAWFFDEYKKSYYLAIPLMLFCNFLELLPPRIFGQVTDGLVDGTLQMSALQRYLLLFFIVFVAIYVLNIIWGYLLFRADDKISYLARQRIFKRLLLQGPGFYGRHSVGAILSRASGDVESLGAFVAYGIMAMIDATVRPALIMLMMFLISWRLSLITIAPLLLIVYLSRTIGMKLYERYDEVQAAYDRLNEEVLETVSGIRVVRAYNLAEMKLKRFFESSQNLFEKNMRAVRLTRLYAPLGMLIPGISMILAIYFGFNEIRHDRMTLGLLLSFVFYLQKLIWPMISMGEFINTGQKGSASMDRINQILDEPLDVDPKTLTAQMPAHGTLEISDLSFTYPGTEQEVLKDISLSLPEGQSLGIVGPVGSGKSTLIKQLLHFYPMRPGTLSYGGQDLSEVRVDELRKLISYVPQESYLFSDTVAGNIQLGASDELLESENLERQLKLAVQRADLEKDLPQLEDGLETLVGERGVTLSGGQKQRVSLARALMDERSILIFDDCLSAVDALTEERILAALREYRRGKTSIIAAHRLSALRDADEIIVLDQGRIIDRGTHAELSARPGWYREQYLRQQIQGEEADDE